MADWFERIRARYQKAQAVPPRDLATMLLGVAQPPVTVQATPPMYSDADYAQPTMAPAGLFAPKPAVPQPRPAPVPTPVAAAPNPADAAYVPPMPAPVAVQDGQVVPPDYRYLNPTPSLEEVYRRELAANPNGFGRDNLIGRLVGLLGK